MFNTVLIANRGEIAVRVIAACQELGIRTVAIYSDVDRTALHVRRADEARSVGASPAVASYLNATAIIAAARDARAEAIHPGYGFLSENADFAQACIDAGMVFIGPPPSAIRLMGSKIAAKHAVEAAGVRTVPGYSGPAKDGRALLREAQRIGFPIMIKAAAGGGGKGMRVVSEQSDFIESLEAARREAQAAFGDDGVFLEKLVIAPRHVEFQILADAHGNVIHLGERECSIQRRHQKIIEESPCAVLTENTRAEMGAAAVAAARAAGYVNAGTCEFLLDARGSFYFLEMNTRLQVEHPITEAVTGIDLVHQQLHIAAGERLNMNQAQIVARGHAIEARLYAEDPTNQYLPSTGTLLDFASPTAPGIRVDAGVAAGDDISMFYDPMLAKLVVRADTRDLAVARLRWALNHFAILGVTTNLSLLQAIAHDAEFAQAHTDTDFLTRRGLVQLSPPNAVPANVLAAGALFEALSLSDQSGTTSDRNPWSSTRLASADGQRRIRLRWKHIDHRVTVAPHRNTPNAFEVKVNDSAYPSDGSLSLTAVLVSEHELLLNTEGAIEIFHVARQRSQVLVSHAGATFTLERPRPPDVDAVAHTGGILAGDQQLVAPMAGTIIKVNVGAGQHVQPHQTLIELGAMKMEHAIAAPYAGRVRRVTHRVGDVVSGGEPLVELEATNCE